MRLHSTIAAALAAATCTLAGSAHADDPLCSSLAGPSVWIENGDTQENLLKKLGQQLVNSSSPLRVIYKNLPTCTLAGDIFTNKKMTNTAGRAIRYIPTLLDDPTWDPSKPAPTCTADVDGNPIQLGIGATYLSSCAGLTQPVDVGVFKGPVQSYGFIVPKQSSQIAITAEEGFFAFGYQDDTGQAGPWTDQNLRFIRAATASTALTLSAAINIKASKLKGTIPTNNTSSEVVSLVSGSATPEKTIGLLGTEVFDGDRSLVKLLAFKGFGQRFGYFPDATSTSFDKQNVRDGHYLPWAPTPYITKLAGNNPSDPAAKRIVDLVVYQQSESDVSGLDAVIASGLVPECAMKVRREFDGGDLTPTSSLDVPEPCTCYFEAKVPQGATKCATCANDTTCGGGKCRRGYCEAY